MTAAPLRSGQASDGPCRASSSLRDDPARSEGARLTPWQLAVCATLAAGYATSDKEIAQALGLRASTVHMRLNAAMRIVGVHNRMDLVRWWLRRQSTITGARYVARFLPLPDPRPGHRPECGCSVCFMRAEPRRRKAA